MANHDLACTSPDTSAYRYLVVTLFYTVSFPERSTVFKGSCRPRENASAFLTRSDGTGLIILAGSNGKWKIWAGILFQWAATIQSQAQLKSSK